MELSMSQHWPWINSMTPQSNVLCQLEVLADNLIQSSNCN